MNDPTNSEQVEGVDHRAEAIRLIEAAQGIGRELNIDPTPGNCLEASNAQATLALVDEVAKLNQDRRERRASVVKEARMLLREAVDGQSGRAPREWNDRVRKVLAQFEAADHA